MYIKYRYGKITTIFSLYSRDLLDYYIYLEFVSLFGRYHGNKLYDNKY